MIDLWYPLECVLSANTPRASLPLRAGRHLRYAHLFEHPSMEPIFSGLAIYGGLIGGAWSVYVYCRLWTLTLAVQWLCIEPPDVEEKDLH